LEIEIDNVQNISLIYSSYNIKSVVSDAKTGDIYITSPDDIPGYQTWQTDRIVNITKGNHYIRPGAKFYKVRLWQTNNFSYD